MLPRVDAGRTIGPIPIRDGAQLVDFYPWLKTLHILFAIVAVGFNISYGIWLFRAAREPEHAGWALRGIKFMDDRVANPSYIGLAVVGILLVLIGRWEFTDLWVAAAIVLYVLLAIVALGAYSPTLTRQIAAYEAGGASSAEFLELGRRGRVLGGVTGVLVGLIIVLMVLKPTI